MDDYGEKRKCTRIRFGEPIDFHVKDGSRYGSGLTRDLSEGGLKLTFNDFVALNTEFNLQFRLGNNEFVECLGRVVWIEKLPFAEQYQAGLEFIGEETKFNSQTRIHQFIQPSYKK